MLVTITEAATQLRSRRVSSVELTQESLRRIRESQPRFNAFITITDELALEQARRADEEFAHGVDRGPLHGIPYSLKDLFDTRGIRTTGGSKIFAHHIPDRDAEVYRKLTEAGAVLTGKNGMHELAYGITSNNPHFGPVRNPHDMARIPGGSSGGSAAAVAADLVFFSIGTDTGGSIRVPAAYCGCVGLKPTYGRVSRAGVFPLGYSLDHVGPFARTVRDAALVMDAIAEPVPESRETAGRRIGVPENYFNERLSPEVAAAFDRTLTAAEAAGCRLVPITVPDPAEINSLGRLLLLCEAAAAFRPLLNRRDEIGADVLALIDQGLLIPAVDYIDARRLRRVYRKRWAEVWTKVDVILTPTTSITAPLIGQTIVGEEEVRMASTRFVRPFNVLGIPALSIPVPTDGLPIGIQVVGPALGDSTVLEVSELLERALKA